MKKKYNVYKDKNIGTVIFILEGSKTEFNLLETIFVKFLNYEMAQLKRGTEGFVFKGKNPYSKVIALNFAGNHLYEMEPEELNQLFFKMSHELGLKPDALPIYYIYDRDVKSYKKDEVRFYVKKYTDPYGTNDGTQGLLLLSYPAIESFIVSCFYDETYKLEFEKGKELKRFSDAHNYNQQLIRSEDDFLHAVNELIKYFNMLGIDDIDMNNIKKMNVKIYDEEQKYYIENKSFQLVSLFIIVLLDLGIIQPESEE